MSCWGGETDPKFLHVLLVSGYWFPIPNLLTNLRVRCRVSSNGTPTLCILKLNLRLGFREYVEIAHGKFITLLCQISRVHKMFLPKQICNVKFIEKLKILAFLLLQREFCLSGSIPHKGVPQYLVYLPVDGYPGVRGSPSPL